jgi:hypothetical protein
MRKKGKEKSNEQKERNNSSVITKEQHITYDNDEDSRTRDIYDYLALI